MSGIAMFGIAAASDTRAAPLAAQVRQAPLMLGATRITGKVFNIIVGGERVVAFAIGDDTPDLGTLQDMAQSRCLGATIHTMPLATAGGPRRLAVRISLHVVGKGDGHVWPGSYSYRAAGVSRSLWASVKVAALRATAPRPARSGGKGANRARAKATRPAARPRRTPAPPPAAWRAWATTGRPVGAPLGVPMLERAALVGRRP